MGSPGAQGHPSLLAPACGGNRPALFPCRCRPGRAASLGWPRGSDPRCSPRPAPPARGHRAGQQAGRSLSVLHRAPGARPWVLLTQACFIWDGSRRLSWAASAPQVPPGHGAQGRLSYAQPLLLPALAVAPPGKTSLKPCSLPGRPHSSSLLETGYFHSPAFQPH